MLEYPSMTNNVCKYAVVTDRLCEEELCAMYSIVNSPLVLGESMTLYFKRFTLESAYNSYVPALIEDVLDTYELYRASEAVEASESVTERISVFD